jgi:hypothetical protein
VARPISKPYRKRYCRDLIEHMKAGDSAESFGIFLAEKYKNPKLLCGKDTIYGWIKDHEEFAEAKTIGIELMLRYWLEIGKAGILGQLKRIAKETPVIDKEGRPVVDREGKVVTIKEYEPAAFGQAAWIFTMKNKGWRDKLSLFNGDTDGSGKFGVSGFAGLMKKAEEEEALESAEKSKDTK